jgi:UDP-3-O-[3-hydroxymyristoyl] N-acetylglucosamine deacetylase
MSNTLSPRTAGSPGQVYRQTTLRSPIQLSGQGMHTGEQGQVTLKPAPANHGIQFERNGVSIPATAEYVANTRRATRLGSGETSLDTVEHLLSALYGLQIDNVIIEAHGPEIPILDGSARPWVRALREAGIEELQETGSPLLLSETVALRDGDSWMVAVPSPTFSITCVTHFDHPLLGTESATFFADPDLYAKEIAPARTFGFIAEVEALRAAGLALGGSLDNALIIFDDHFSDALRVPQECLRHKMLDLWGDLSLVGGRLCAAVTAIKPGHRINTAFAALLAEKIAVSSQPDSSRIGG